MLKSYDFLSGKVKQAPLKTADILSVYIQVFREHYPVTDKAFL